MKTTLTAILLLLLTLPTMAQRVYKKGDTVWVYKHHYVLVRDSTFRGARQWYAINEKGRWAWIHLSMLPR